ncbi:leucyl/phenylalanyl-tRNA--protein transferase [Endozoicomonas sp. Mp262]|uniref:leucyl/phenylalanyl-tRNA--protein transferase n=1 Tax=Endozoicomonas sp. Mp262 TaxID=2919499 RepID=UPI0021D913AF
MTERIIAWLDETDPSFPDTGSALTDPNGLLAAGGNLSAATLLAAYRHGVFPWFNKGEPILWWSPNPRMVIYPDKLHISRSLAKLLKKNSYKVTCDRAFHQVIKACSAPRSYTRETWITEEMIEAYHSLHTLGHAHSVEVWENDQLVGGLYGVAIGQVFFGESMFSKKNNASKVAFAWLCKHLLQWQIKLVDCQVYSPHLESLGGITIPRDQFVELIGRYCQALPSGANWNFEWQWNDLSNDITKKY